MSGPGEKLYQTPPIDPRRRRNFRFFMLFWAVLFASAIGVQLMRMARLSDRWTGDGKNPDTYGFDLSNLQIDRAVLAASHRPRDARPVMDQVIPVTQEEIQNHNSRFGSYLRFLVPADVVVGIALNGEARAYPLRFMRVHEIVNDRVGGKPVAVTYCQLTDSVVVFDRRLNGREMLFGYSGLLHNSGLVMYDREPPAGTASTLWSQIPALGISGPGAGKKLMVYPFFMGSWEEWRVRHPGSTVLNTVASLKDRYKNDELQQHHYFDKQETWFPVSPKLRAGSRYRPMDRVGMTADALSEESHAMPVGRVIPVERETALSNVAGPGRTFWATACWFAWVAMHPEADQAEAP